MESFDQSLKYLLQKEPADFIRFGLGDPTVQVLGPVPSGLPARGRDVDGVYLIARGAAHGQGGEPRDEDKRVAHIELHRRHQGLEDLSVDVAEAQIRLFRRERRRVLSQVWDLYGDPGAPVLDERSLWYGDAGSRCVYQRVNLRGLRWEELLSQGPPALWSLVALTRDGRSKAGIEKARGAIEACAAWSSAERADHLAVLWFVAEAEGVAVRLIQAYLTEERLMESELYRRIVHRGRAEGKAEGVLAVLGARGIPVSDAIRARILGCADIDMLDAWIRRAAVASTAAAVVRSKTPPPPSAGQTARRARKA